MSYVSVPSHDSDVLIKSKFDHNVQATHNLRNVKHYRICETNVLS